MSTPDDDTQLEIEDIHEEFNHSETFDIDELIDYTHDEPDDCAADIGDDEDPPNDPIHLQNTRFLKEKLGRRILVKVKNVIASMKNEGLNLPLLLDAMFYGDPECHADPEVQYQRTALMVSEELPGLLERWYDPPTRGPGHKGQRPQAAKRVLKEFSTQIVSRRIESEMKHLAPIFLSPPDQLSKEQLVNLNFQSLMEDCQRLAPTFWALLRHAAYTPEQERYNTHKDPNLVVLSIISQCQYTRSHRRGRVAKAWSIYLKACGMSARAFDAIHYLGLTMSHKWTAEAVKTLAESAMQEVRKVVQTEPFILSYDNLNLALRVFSQRLNHQSHFQSGCAATIWVLPLHAALPDYANAELREHRRLMSTSTFDIGALISGTLTGGPAADRRLRSRFIYVILSALLNNPQFKDYPPDLRNHALLQPPPPVDELSCSDGPTVTQYMLKTPPIEEASYDGNDKALAEWMRQLGMDSEDEQRILAYTRILACCGDQLTMERLRGLAKFRFSDFNSFDRMEYLVLVFGWLHLVMQYASSLHKQYFAGPSDVGLLRHAIELLNKRKLSNPGAKGPYWADLDAALRHISEAHWLTCWQVISGEDDLANLQKRSPAELRSLATSILDRFATRAAMVRLNERCPEGRVDAVLEKCIMWNSDILPYLELTDAIKHGDVGRMEDLLPSILFRFAGGANHKYTVEVLELLQGLYREWTPAVRDFVRRHCWLVNQSGRRDGFLAVDHAQELNIKDIKWTYHSMGPGATWDYLEIMSPAIPTLRAVQRHVEREFKTLTRGAKHTEVSKDLDVRVLQEHYLNAGLYDDHPGRGSKAHLDKVVVDYISDGTRALENGEVVSRWWTARTFHRSQAEEW